MSPVPLLLVAIGVSADAFAVALGKGLQMRRLDQRSALTIAGTFGAFQAGMPLVGWLLGSQFARHIETVDHWIAFALLAAVGARMLVQASRPDDPTTPSAAVRPGELLLLGLATSVDALAVGVGLALLDVSIATAVAVIGTTTFVLCYVGVLVGHRAGLGFRRLAEAAGGLILVAIGASILWQHLRA